MMWRAALTVLVTITAGGIVGHLWVACRAGLNAQARIDADRARVARQAEADAWGFLATVAGNPVPGSLLDHVHGQLTAAGPDADRARIILAAAAVVADLPEVPDDAV